MIVKTKNIENKKIIVRFADDGSFLSLINTLRGVGSSISRNFNNLSNEYQNIVRGFQKEIQA
jgi:hypothetical protein